MARETLTQKRERAAIVTERMAEHYADAKCALDWWGDPFKLAVAVMLSAQTTDKGVNKVTPTLWERYPRVADLAAADPTEVAAIISSIGCYRVKAARAVEMAQRVLADFGGELPADMEALQTLPGVGRKSANVVMSEAFNLPQGIAVDTHVNRIAHKLALVPAREEDPNKVEAALLKVFPREIWGDVNRRWVLFGRETCIARRPKCEECFLADICPTFHKK
jgi:endonuclease-3